MLVGLAHLLRVRLARNEEDTQLPVPNLVLPSSTSKIKKYLALLLDRLANGGSLHDNTPSAVARE